MMKYGAPMCFCVLCVWNPVCHLELDFGKWERRGQASQIEVDLGLWSERVAWDGREKTTVVKCLPTKHKAWGAEAGTG